MANLETGVARKQSMLNFPKNEYFLPLDKHTLRNEGVRNIRGVFFGKFGMLCFLVTAVLRFGPCKISIFCGKLYHRCLTSS